MIPYFPWALLVSAHCLGLGVPECWVPMQAAHPSSLTRGGSQCRADGTTQRCVLLPELISSTWWLPRPDLKASLSQGKPGAGGLGRAGAVWGPGQLGLPCRRAGWAAGSWAQPAHPFRGSVLGSLPRGDGCGVEACPSTELCPAHLHAHPSSVGTCLSPGCPAL